MKTRKRGWKGHTQAGAATASKTFVPFSVKASDEAALTFTGLAAAWTEDAGRDVIEPGAFARTLDHWRAAKDTRPVPLVDQHSYGSVNRVLGKMTEAAETDAGLEATFAMIAGDDDAVKAYRRVKGGYVTGLSIGYEPVRWEYEAVDNRPSWDQVRHLLEVKLLEVSLVVFPMNDDARIDLSSVKALLSAARRPGLAGDEADRVRAELTRLQTEFGALLTETTPDSPPAESAKGLAPDDPTRLEAEHILRDVTIRGLATAG